MTRTLLLAIVAVVTLLAGNPKPAECQGGCLPTFCGSSAECPGPCICAIPMGKATGSCMGTR
jgi:hypothetical protein